MPRERTLSDLLNMLDTEQPVALVDVRSPEDYAAGHLPGARNVPLPDIEAAPTSLPPSRPIVTLCGKGGGRSAAAAALLEAAGAVDVASLAGGTGAWAAAGHPLATGPSPQE